MMKKVNLFTLMMILATFAVVFRLVDLSSFSTPSSIAQGTPAGQKFEPVAGAASPEAEKKDAPAPSPEVADKGAAEAAPAVATADAPASEANPAPASSVYGEHAYSAAELDVLQSLSKRRDELDKREQQVGQHEALLKAAEGEVDRKIAELNKIKGELVELLNKQQAVQGERVTSLVKIYEGMKPKEAARIFDTLDMDVLLAVISKMKEQKSSPILAAMDPEKARIVTIKLTEQHKLPDGLDDAKKGKPAPATSAETPAATPAVTAPAPAPPATPAIAAPVAAVPPVPPASPAAATPGAATPAAEPSNTRTPDEEQAASPEAPATP